MKVLKITAFSMILALSAFSANAKHDAVDCSTCTTEFCKTAPKKTLKGCADCPGTEVFDCGVGAFKANGCDKKPDSKSFNGSSQCKSAARMMAKAGYAASQLVDPESSESASASDDVKASAQKVMDGFKALDEANLGASKGTAP